MDSVYAACAPARSPAVHEASPASAPAAARTRSPSGGASDSACRARAIVPARSPCASASAARYISTAAGTRPVAASSTTTRPGGGCCEPGPVVRAQGAFDAGSRSSIEAKSDTCASAPTNATPSTGRTRTTSSGSDAHPAGELGFAPFPLHRRHRELHEVRGSAGVAAGQGVADRLRRVAVGLEPGTGPAVQVGHLVRPLVEQVRAQDVGEQVVVAVPLPPVVERDEEQVGPLERLEPRPAAAPVR